MNRMFLLMSLVSLFISGPAQSDPMRPFILPAAASAASSASAPPLARAPGEPASARPAGDLLAIRIDSQGRHQALIGERWVAVGERIEHSTVSAMDASTVEFTRGKVRATVHLLTPLVASADGANTPLTTATQPLLPKRKTTSVAQRSTP